MKLKRAVVALSAAVVILSGAAQAVPRYSVTDLGTTLGGAGYSTSGINASGQVVGNFTVGRSVDSRSHAFLYSGGVMTDIDTLGGHTIANGINDRGQVVGWSSRDPDFFTRDRTAFLYSGGIMTELGTIDGSPAPLMLGYDINASGQVAASSYTTVGQHHAVLYNGGGVGTDLGALGGNSGFSQANGVNDSGQVVGFSEAPAVITMPSSTAAAK